MEKKKLKKAVLDLPMEGDELTFAEKMHMYLNSPDAEKLMRGDPEVMQSLRAYPDARTGFDVKDVNQLEPGETFVGGGVQESETFKKIRNKLMGK